LHLYQQHLVPGQVQDVRKLRRSADQILSDISDFATAFFEWTHFHCPTLRVLVWGQHAVEGDAFEELIVKLGEETTAEYVPQFIFVKRESVGEDGERRISASLTTHSRFCDELPQLDLLSYDPGLRGRELYALQT
jgi:hypothetical protein